MSYLRKNKAIVLIAFFAFFTFNVNYTCACLGMDMSNHTSETCKMKHKKNKEIKKMSHHMTSEEAHNFKMVMNHSDHKNHNQNSNDEDDYCECDKADEKLEARVFIETPVNSFTYNEFSKITFSNSKEYITILKNQKEPPQIIS